MQKGSIKIIKWTDKKSVCMLSTREDHNDTLIDTAKVRNGEPVQKPKCVVDYNKAKIGVDYSDQMSSYQNVLRKGMKWYRKVAREIIFGAAMTNAWILHNAKFTKKQLSIHDFKDMVCKGLFEHSCESEIQRPRTPKRIHTLTEGGPDAKKGANVKGAIKFYESQWEAELQITLKKYTHVVWNAMEILDIVYHASTKPMQLKQDKHHNSHLVGLSMFCYFLSILTLLDV
ncbi:hypothetical protein JTB14_008972 [Gonioctena quinquepunctata]|nr:hypothetical protein JTB14_008972 [Gonioctena quinquepunctata]